jgi:hypothetical protein
VFIFFLCDLAHLAALKGGVVLITCRDRSVSGRDSGSLIAINLYIVAFVFSPSRGLKNGRPDHSDRVMYLSSVS